MVLCSDHFVQPFQFSLHVGELRITARDFNFAKPACRARNVLCDLRIGLPHRAVICGCERLQ
jgi:hypothetical protein